MKKIVLLTLALSSSVSLSAANVAKLTTDILENNVRKLNFHLRQEKPSSDQLEMLSYMAKEKNNFYQVRLSRWKKARGLAIAGTPIEVILGAIIGFGVHRILNPPEPAGVGAFGTGLGFHGTTEGIVGGTVVGTALIAWTEKNIKKWQKQLDDSNKIVTMINDKLAQQPTAPEQPQAQ